jgi:small subunit ribosomal protein S13
LSSSEYRHIVRIAGKDVDGSKKLVVALSEIRGIGFNFAQVLLNTLKIDPDIRVGFLTEDEVGIIENGIKNPESVGMPHWFLNRRKDVDSGAHSQLIAADWDIAVHGDVEREKGVMSWRGFRHMMGLKVRGQRTRTTGRKGGAVGVKKTGKVFPTAAPEEGAGAAAATGAAAPAGAPAAAAGGAKGTAPGKETGKEVPKSKEEAKPAAEKKPASEKGAK